MNEIHFSRNRFPFVLLTINKVNLEVCLYRLLGQFKKKKGHGTGKNTIVTEGAPGDAAAAPFRRQVDVMK